MDNLFELIPKDKFDNSSIPLLNTMNVQDAVPILGELLEWIQDINWPIAQELIEVLPRFHMQLVPHIKSVLHADDDIWKCWTLCLIQKFPKETVLLLASDIKRIAYNPTASEIDEGAHEYALGTIKQFDL